MNILSLKESRGGSEVEATLFLSSVNFAFAQGGINSHVWMSTTLPDWGSTNPIDR